MKKLKHSKFKNTGILFEMLVRKLTSETLTTEKSVTIDIIKKYFGKNTELAKELQLYTSIIREQFNSDAKAFEFIRSLKQTHDKLNKTELRRQRYNLVKEIAENFSFDKFEKIRIPNYKVLASAYMIFEHDEVDNPKQLLECKNAIVDHILSDRAVKQTEDHVLNEMKSKSKDVRLLTYKLLVDKFNSKYSGLNESQKQLLNKYITHIEDSVTLKEYIETVIPNIKSQLAEHVELIDDAATKIKVQRLSEMLCNVETIKVIKESHILTLLRYFDLIRELKEVH
jgi:hypothetical protein